MKDQREQGSARNPLLKILLVFAPCFSQRQLLNPPTSVRTHNQVIRFRSEIHGDVRLPIHLHLGLGKELRPLPCRRTCLSPRRTTQQVRVHQASLRVILWARALSFSFESTLRPGLQPESNHLPSISVSPLRCVMSLSTHSHTTAGQDENLSCYRPIFRRTWMPSSDLSAIE